MPDVEVAGLWLQDWVGTHHTSAGTQLWWNWFLDEKNTMQAGDNSWTTSTKDGGRVLLYINPFLAKEEGHDRAFSRSESQGVPSSRERMGRLY